MDFPERDDCGCKMVEAEEAAFELFIPHEQFANAIEPAMRDFHNPPPGALRRMPPLLLGFLPAPFDVGNVCRKRTVRKSPYTTFDNISAACVIRSRKLKMRTLRRQVCFPKVPCERVE